MNKILACAAAGALSMLSVVTAFADQPRLWETDFQEAASPLMAGNVWFEAYTLWFIVPITLLVTLLLVWCVIRYREGANPTPSTVSHNTRLEVVWTLIPVLILLLIAGPSFNLLRLHYNSPEAPGLIIKATGNQWYWSYEYQVDAGLSFDSIILKDEERDQYAKQDRARYPRLLAVDNELVAPVNTTVKVLVTGADVIHAFAMPAFGVKVDAVTGRTNEAWFKATKEGLYYGQCSELCGKDHAFMPIAIRIVSAQQYEAWLNAAKTDLSAANKALMAAVDGDPNLAVAGN